jgi:hypothetical protein
MVRDRFTIELEHDEFEALAKLARSERRSVRDEAAILLRKQLEAMGLLAKEDARATSN